MKAKRRIESAAPVLASPRVSIMGRARVTVEAHRGINEFSPGEVRVRLSDGCLIIAGAGLSVDCMSESSLAVSGSIASVAFVE